MTDTEQEYRRLANRYERALKLIAAAKAVSADRLREIADHAVKTGGDGRRSVKTK